MRILWTPAAQNRKTGRVPTAYVGTTREETWESCDGCLLRGTRCYAWQGTQAAFGLSKVHRGFVARPRGYTVLAALRLRRSDARIVRVAAIGDPARADRVELMASLSVVRSTGLGVVGYTHFWADSENAELRPQLMASCDDLDEADQAVAAGWKATTILPTDHEGPVFVTPAGNKGVVCPAQRRDDVTCNTCRMCDPQHRVWRAGKVHIVGFLDHSRQAVRRAALRSGRRLPTAGVAGAHAPTGWGS